MFWRLGYGHTSPVEQLLERDDFTLQQLLEEQDIIQECKQLNKKLIDYLACPAQVKALIEYVVVEPPADSGDNEKFIYPYKASEVLASDLNAVYDCLFANDELICKLFSFLDQEEPLNALLAGHFGKIVATLLSRRPFETFKVIETKGIVPRLLKHLNTYSVLELLLKVVSEVVESDSSEQEVAWLYRIGLVEQLIEKLSKTQDSEVHANASVALVGIVSQSQGMHWQGASMPAHKSRFATDLLEAKSVSALLDKILEGTPSTLQHGLNVLVVLLRHCTQSSKSAWELEPVVNELLNRLGELVNVLTNPPAMVPITNTTGTIEQPLGSNRLKILEVVQELIRLRNRGVEAKMIELKVLSTCLDLFLKYEWHTFLHNLVKNVVEEVLQGDSEDLKKSLFEDGEILERIIDAHHKNDDYVKQPKSCRKGYMGQLRLISNLIVKQADVDPWMHEYTARENWKEFWHRYMQPANELNDREQLGAAKLHRGKEEEEDPYASPPNTNDYNSGMQFRAPDQQDDLFDQDIDNYDGDNVELGGLEMDVDVHDQSDDPQTVLLSESVSAMHVDADDVTREDRSMLQESPDYNDINFWKPKMNWFNSEDAGGT